MFVFLMMLLKYRFFCGEVVKLLTLYAPNFEEVEGAYWFGSVGPLVSSGVQSVCDA